MNQALLECERVNERLERGTRRARTARAIDLAVDFDLVEIGGTDLRKHFHRARVHQYRGRVFNPAIATPGNVIGDSSLDRLLLLYIECGHDFVAAVRILQDLLNKMRRQKSSVSLHARPKFAAGEIAHVATSSVVPIRLREVDRTIVV